MLPPVILFDLDDTILDDTGGASAAWEQACIDSGAPEGLYDAIRAADVPVVEVHLTNPDAREPFRRRSCVAPACVGRVAGFGAHSYRLGLDALLMARTP